ncbi:polysaccharide biosynthesis tyrosine autokinase [Psychroserpens sp.]|uniref:GumC family protein n=1 Tax=Psychroserpens sp. TaxID=2020870 RepID=UPI001B0E40CB|nr:polysaccharide biosynthesis tyrosine autokinase [Psychroserpens sp.]MBO6606493.1 polysaccharide biosynthesis tyrosine autokinase [Psychroserpens sp.]MBO6653197.1 polysaccharide biosynthesis tyrosine autokinase [Psychroserpens sp.]MBO6680775.1 polysaccharide biosynthesis tyrosine autokinase [Psychroserpens sp.]MBO6750267.1 polysaccharide biosynthesis tyrosine autokinase [Psychroserpens sp.]MBO6914748.1 polysaccharide biosynthesis tyrosine autokinase [Psychroserpens sp.]
MNTNKAHGFQNELRDTVDLFISKWKFIVLALLLAIGVAYVYLRYANYEYEATATIKIKSENQQQQQLAELSALQDYGLFSSNYSNISDEIEIIKSRTLVQKVVEDLKLNIQYYVKGNIKDQEVYENPPVNLNFFESDSIISRVDTTLYLKVKSPNKFSLSNEEGSEIFNYEASNAKEYAFGERINSGFGDFIITPNTENLAIKPGTSLKIELSNIERVVESYQKKILTLNETGSNIIKISLKENIKHKAALILDKIIQKYNDDVIEDKEKVVKATSDFINNRLNVVSNELEQVDFTAETLQKNNRLTALNSQADIFLQSEKANDAKIINTTNQIQLVDYMKDRLNSDEVENDLLPADIGIADNSVLQITKSHNDLVLQRDRILKNSTEKNPTVINLNEQIAALKLNLNQSLDNIRSANSITLNALNREDARISSQLYTAPTKARQFRDVKRQQDIKESLYLYLLQKREETAISQGMSSPNAKIVDKAYVTVNPVSPNKNVVYLASIILGLLIPFGAIYTRSLLDTKIHTKADLLKLVSIPYLGDIPKSDKKLKVMKKVDYSPKAEAFRIIRSNINFLLQDSKNKCKTIFVTSTKAQEGKSHTSTNLSNSFSFSEKRVLLIETDIRVPRVNDYLKIKADRGLTDYISDKSLSMDDVVVHIEDNKYLDVIPSGTIPPNPAELLMSERVSELFDIAKKTYDYIIVDTAAVGLVTDTLLISDHADIFVYVVSVDNIDKRELHIAQTLYEEKRLPKMTVLLNGTTKKKGYGYGYGNNPQRKKKWYQRS